MTREELFAVIRGIVLNVTGVAECILDDQNAPAPTGEYCSIEPFSNIRHIGRGSIKQTEVDAVDESNYLDIEEELTTLLEARVDINFFRGDARLHAQKLMFSDQRSDVYQTLFSNGLGWMRTDQVNNLTVLNSAIYESRAQISIYIQFEQPQTNIVQQIYSVDLEVRDQFNNTIAIDDLVVGNGDVVDLSQAVEYWSDALE